MRLQALPLATNVLLTNSRFGAKSPEESGRPSPQSERMRRAVQEAADALEKKDGKKKPRGRSGSTGDTGGRRSDRGGWSGHADSVGEGRLAGYRAIGIGLLGVLALAGVGGILWKVADISQKATDNNAMPFNQPGLQAELDKMNGVSPGNPPAPTPNHSAPTKKGVPGKNNSPKKAPRLALKLPRQRFKVPVRFQKHPRAFSKTA